MDVESGHHVVEVTLLVCSRAACSSETWSRKTQPPRIKSSHSTPAQQGKCFELSKLADTLTLADPEKHQQHIDMVKSSVLKKCPRSEGQGDDGQQKLVVCCAEKLSMCVCDV